jgi:hypothetical protein
MPSDEKVTTVWSGFLTFPSKNIHKSNWYLITMKMKRMKTQHDSLLGRMKNQVEQHTRKPTLESYRTVWHSNVLTGDSKSHLLTIQKKNAPVRTSNQTMACLQIKNIPYLYTIIQQNQLDILNPSSLWFYTIHPRNHFCKIISYFPQSSGPFFRLVA